MVEHYCEIHNCKFYENQAKDGKPNWWSHKLKDGEGYCNEKKKKEQTPAVAPDAVATHEIFLEDTPKKEAKEPGYRNPINRSISLSYAKDLCVAGKIEVKDISAYADKFLKYMEEESKS